MFGKDFVLGVKTPVKNLTSVANGMTYLPWATAVALAGRPDIRVDTFGGHPYRELFGGAVVSVSTPLPTGEGSIAQQAMHLPVLDAQNRPVPIEALTSRDVSDTINRARAKLIAVVNGVGMSLYAGYGEDVLGFLKALGLTPESDLATAQPLTSSKNGKAQYVDWAAAVTAARLTDPGFYWEVVEHDNQPDPETGEVLHRAPYVRTPHGYLVAVRVHYKGAVHTEWLPVMGVVEVKTARGTKRLDHQPLEDPNVFDWNRAIMRCLAKAIAVVSGYGLSVYAGEDVEALQVQPLRRKQDAESEASDADDDARGELIRQVRQALEQAGKEEEAMLQWLGRKGDAMEDLTMEELQRALKALTPRRQAA